MNVQVEAVFENGVFRPLNPVDLPQQTRVTVSVPTDVPHSDNSPEISKKPKELTFEEARQLALQVGVQIRKELQEERARETQFLLGPYFDEEND